MNKTELIKLRKAINSMQTVDDTLSIQGKDFSCRWNGNNFTWTPPSGWTFFVTAREIIKWIEDGSEVTDYCFSYGE